MLIANPIYDVVFKYLMEDSKVAKLLLSAILGVEILELNFKPQELIAEVSVVKASEQKSTKKRDLETTRLLTIYRLDFSALIRTPEGQKIIIIEIQKARIFNDVTRFRNYLGKQYSNQEYMYVKQLPKGKNVKLGIPIVTIYFLGERLENIQGIPVLKIDRKVIDLFSGEEIAKADDFIESLTHQSYIIIIPDLKEKRRNELERLLGVFDQTQIDANSHILNISEDAVPQKYRDLLRRLHKAALETTMRQQMDLEDEFLNDYLEIENQLNEKERLLALAEQKIQTEKLKAEAKEKELETEKLKAETERQKAETERQKAETERQKLYETARKMKAKKFPIQDIAEFTGLSHTEIEKL